ncbi:MAG: C1 family peptidase [Polyangiales bacterium]
MPKRPAKTATSRARKKPTAAEQPTSAQRTAVEITALVKPPTRERPAGTKRTAAERAAHALRIVAEQPPSAKRAAAEKAARALRAAAEKPAKRAAAEKAARAQPTSAEKTPRAKRAGAEKAARAKRADSARVGSTRRAVPIGKKRKLDACPDRVDVRDWLYQPTLAPLPDTLVNCHLVPSILDQGSEGACTGFALAAVINFHLARRNLARGVSPYMLYDMARHYDEWPGASYEGSSARGAMKGWAAHGVCSDESWPSAGTITLDERLAKEAALTPGGAFYRVAHRNLRDMHAALAESGILYATLMVHQGWDAPGPNTIEVHFPDAGSVRSLELPVITRKGRAEDGHAVAIVGYTSDGFIVQNSWGSDWGHGGFALLPYEDYLLHATDVWVAQLGVPVHMTSWTRRSADNDVAGLSRAAAAIPLADIRPYVVNIGHRGELSSNGVYWTSRADLRHLIEEVIPQKTQSWSRRRILLYLHGGLNDERAVAERIVAHREVMLANQIYPLHIMWETGIWETIGSLLRNLLTDDDGRAGRVASWLSELREGLDEAKDRSLELTVAAAGGALWREMQENARLASNHPQQRGGMELLANHAVQVLSQLSAADKGRFEVHVVGHSAGCVFAAHALPHLAKLGSAFKSIQFLAPALTLDSWRDLVARYVDEKRCPQPSVYVLSDKQERADQVGPYGKSLLYLVSNAFEKQRGTPLLGMARFVQQGADGDTSDVNADVAAQLARRVDRRPSLVVAGASQAAGSRSECAAHGGFDEDPATLNSVLQRILQAEPVRPFGVRDLAFSGQQKPQRERTSGLTQPRLPGVRQPANDQVRSRRVGA